MHALLNLLYRENLFEFCLLIPACEIYLEYSTA